MSASRPLVAAWRGRLTAAKFTTQEWNYRCELLIGAKMVPDRAGADTQVMVHIALYQSC
jgi:hypothetical protein